MNYTHVGRLGLVVSRLCLGTMNFGPHTSEPDSHALMDSAVAHGINFFDTANVYGRHLGVGATEEIIGRWFAKGGGRRDKVVLATKVFGKMGDWPNESRLSKLAIRKACEASLRRLQTDYIDMYQMHHIDRDAWWDEIWEAMDQLKHEGKILYVGSSNFAGWHIVRANEIANRRHTLGLAAEQSLYNLTARTIEMEVIPAVQEYGMGLIVWSPLAGGPAGRRAAQGGGGSPLAGVHGQGDRGPAFTAPEVGDALRRARREAFRRRPRVAAPSAGGHRAHHRAAHAGSVAEFVPGARHPPLTRGAGQARRDLPRAGGPAPEAYAW